MKGKKRFMIHNVEVVTMDYFKETEDQLGRIERLLGMKKELTKAIQEIIDLLDGDGIIFLPAGVHSVIGLVLPLGVWVCDL